MRRYKAIIVLLSLIFLVGQSCNLGSIGSKNDKTQEDDFRGVEGLVMKFVDGLPPKNVWKGIEFGVWVEVQNKGLNDINVGKICIGSFPNSVFTKSDSCLSLGKIQGRRVFPQGEIKLFGEKEWEGFRLKDNQEYNKDTLYTISARTCYEGSTTLQPLVCIRDLRTDNKDAVCDTGDIDVGNGGQGAPVSVSSLQEEIIPRGDENELLFNLEVSNVGSGDIIRKEAISGSKECVVDNRQDKDEVRIDVELPGFGKAKCRNDGKIVLINGKGQTVCSGIRIPEGNNFALPLNIKLNYGYVSRLKGEFTIKKDTVEG